MKKLIITKWCTTDDVKMPFAKIVLEWFILDDIEYSEALVMDNLEVLAQLLKYEPVDQSVVDGKFHIDCVTYCWTDEIPKNGSYFVSTCQSGVMAAPYRLEMVDLDFKTDK